MEESKQMEMQTFFAAATTDVAQNLLGKLLVYSNNGVLLTGYIVETEAYLGIEDQACHSYLGRRTPKVEAMYQVAGTIYIYTMHTHVMLNLVTGAKNDPQAVLIRAIQPVKGLEQMVARRQQDGYNISNGPGKLTQALGITRSLNGTHLTSGSLMLDLTKPLTPKKISQTPRIGIPNKGVWTEKLLRYHVVGNPYVSGMKKRELQDNSWLDL